MNEQQWPGLARVESTARAEIAWWTRRRPGFECYVTLPLRLWPIGVAMVFVAAFFSFTWILASVDGQEIILPWLIAIVAAFLTCASAVLVGSFLAALALHALIGVSFWSGARSAGREVGTLLDKVAVLSSRVAAAVILTAPAAMFLATEPSMNGTSPSMTQVKQMGAIQLCLGILLVSVVSVFWAGTATSSLISSVPRYSRLLLATLIPSGLVALVATKFNEIVEYAMRRLLPATVEGHAGSAVAREGARLTPEPNPWVVLAVASVLLGAYLSMRSSDSSHSSSHASRAGAST